jgi:hypothetical protein
MPGPFDYLGAMGGVQSLPNPNAAFAQGVAGAQLQEQNANALAAQKAKMAADAEKQRMQAQRDAQYQAALQQALDNPSPKNFAALSLINPEAHEAIKSGWGMIDKDAQTTALRDLSAVYGYATSGNVESARKIIQNHIDADKTAGQDTSQYEMMAGLLDEPGGLKKLAGISGILLSSAVPDKFAETFKEIGADERADAKLPGEVALGVAQADKAAVEAKMAPKVIESDLASEAATRARQAAQTAIEKSQLALDWDKLALDRDALTTSTQLKLQEMLQSGQKVEGASLTELTAAVGSSQQNQALAERTNRLAEEFEKLPAGTGAGNLSALHERAKQGLGYQDGLTSIRNEFERLKNSQAIKNLPPGAASDKDIEIAKQGFPRSTANREHIISFLRGMAKMQTIAAQADDRKADWISSNGNLGTAKRDLQVGGVKVPAGTTFGEFNRNAVKVGKQGDAPPRSYLDKYGR